MKRRLHFNERMEYMVDKLDMAKTALGIELVLIGADHQSIASGAHEWENRYEEGLWIYHLEDVWTGLRAAYQQLSSEVENKYGVPLTEVGSMGFSGMMHGYLPFDTAPNQLNSLRT